MKIVAISGHAQHGKDTTAAILKDMLEQKYGMRVYGCFYQACYTLKEAMPVKHKDIRRLDITALEYLVYSAQASSEERNKRKSFAASLLGAFAGMK